MVFFFIFSVVSASLMQGNEMINGIDLVGEANRAFVELCMVGAESLFWCRGVRGAQVN